jgi:hypothetical protein
MPHIDATPLLFGASGRGAFGAENRRKIGAESCGFGADAL